MTEPADRPLFQLLRFWSRRVTDHGRDVAVTEAVQALTAGGAPGGALGPSAEVTVNDVARELGVDQSGASRMITNAARLGYLVVRPSTADARRRIIAVTAAGAELTAAAQHWQKDVFAQLTDGWTDDDREVVHRLTQRLLDRSRNLADSPHGNG